MTDDAAIAQFWSECRDALPHLAQEVPEAWAFGATPAHADELLGLVLAGVKTATASSLWDHEHTGEPVPEPGWLNIILDGRGQPQALLETVAVQIVTFTKVSQAHAFAEGEGDRSLATWRDIHERFWRDHSEGPRGYDPDMPVVCEEFRLLYARQPA